MSYARQHDDDVAAVYAPPPYSHDEGALNSFKDPESGNVMAQTAAPTYQPEGGYQQFAYSASQWRDPWFAVAFLVHIIGLIIVAGVYGPQLTSDLKNDPGSGSTTSGGTSLNENAMVGTLAISALVSAFASAAFLSVLQRYSTQLIKLCFALSIGFMLFGAIVSLATGNIIIGVIWIVLAFFNWLYYWTVRDRIPFANATIGASIAALKDFPGPIYFVYAVGLLYVGFLAFWAFTFVAVYHSSNSAQRDGASNNTRFSQFYLLFCLYWTCNVLKGISHVTNAGVVASWWLTRDPAPTGPAIKRACTTSLGSICFGSLILAVIETIKSAVHGARRNARGSEGALLCILECLVSLIDSLFRWLSYQAYIFVAIYGMPFVEAAKSTFDLVQSRGFEVLINQDLSSMVMLLGAFLSATVAGLIGGAWAASSSYDGWQAFAVLAFLMGFVVAIMFYSVLESAVACTFIVWASDPQTMSQNKPQYFQRLVDAAGPAYDAQRGIAINRM